MEDKLQASVQRSFDAILSTTEADSERLVAELCAKAQGGKWANADAAAEVASIEAARLVGLRNVLSRMAWSLTH